ncbi:hypothetical protein JMJ35_007205 [Cladonia borealis]|uniref:Nephrocystin 3-like N-terminal domain-containing protein n=1 Tax=Cladonia borealis TaxID=184061 RepID=A0AA39QZW2_9LECA|nr:hypothetical protein JMJ35_007205 [Cladonia borealis]
MSKAARFKQAIGVRKKAHVSLPVEFMQDCMDGDLSPAIAKPPLQYSSEVSAFVKPERREELADEEDALFSDAKSQLQDLKEVVAKHQQKTGLTPQGVAHFDTVACTWSEIQALIEVATSGLGSDDESDKIKLSCSKIGRNIAGFDNWLNLLPDGDYGAVVCGVFKMVVLAAKQTPESVARAAEYRKLYSDERPQKLIQKTAQLCKAVLVALRHIMTYLSEGSLEGTMKAIIQGSNYKKTLQTHLDEVKDLTAMMDREAGVRSQHSVQYIEEHVHVIETMLRQLQAAKQDIQMEEKMMETIAARIGDAMEERIVNKMFSLLSSSPGVASESIKVAPSASSVTLLRRVPEIDTRLALPGTDVYILLTFQILIDIKGLLSMLGFSEIPARDLRRCLANGHLLSTEDQDRVKWIMRSPQLRMWLNCPRSKSILVNGNKTGNEVFSPTTFLAAKMLETLEAIEPMIRLNFFCSLRATGSKSTKDDAIWMIKSLIAQLLVKDFAWDLTFLSQEDVDRIKADHLQTLCRFFHDLLQQLPKMTFLYWMIDAITFYERLEWRGDFLKAINELLNIMDSCKQVVIKLLLTCHGRSSFIKDYIDDEDILLVPSIIDGDCQGWSDMGWYRSKGKDMNALEDTVVRSEF